jgi:hypothetical protein
MLPNDHRSGVLGTFSRIAAFKRSAVLHSCRENAERERSCELRTVQRQARAARRRGVRGCRGGDPPPDGNTTTRQALAAFGAQLRAVVIEGGVP